MSARRLSALLLACAGLAAAGAGARLAARGGAGGASLAAAEVSGEAGFARDPESVAKKPAYPTQLSEGEGKAIADRWCLLCHSAMLVTQQAKDSTGWEKTLAQMEKWGVVVTPEERDTLRAYLVAQFGRGPRPARAAPAPAPGPPPPARDTAAAPAPPR